VRASSHHPQAGLWTWWSALGAGNGGPVRTPDLPAVFSRSQARAFGVGDVRLAGLVRRGEIQRARPGVYARSGAVPPTPEDRAGFHLLCARAALTHHQSGFVASHLPAAAAHGLPLPPGGPGRVHVTAVDAYQRSRAAPGVRVHHADCSPTDITEVDGLIVTTVARTVADCLRHWPAWTSVPIADAALHRRLITPEALVEQLDRQRHWIGRPRALDALRLVDGRRESWLESYAFVSFDDWGIELPEPQVWVDDADGQPLGRVDGAWLEDGAVVEVDGAAKYLIPVGDSPDPWTRWRMEKGRYDSMGNLGLERVRLTYEDLRFHPVQSRRVIHQRRSAGSRRRFPGSFRCTDPSGLRCLSV
jgi:hypothetical protein